MSHRHVASVAGLEYKIRLNTKKNLQYEEMKVRRKKSRVTLKCGRKITIHGKALKEVIVSREFIQIFEVKYYPKTAGK